MADQLQVIAFLVSERMDDFDEFEDVYVSDRIVGFGYEGVQYALSFWFDGFVGYNATLDNYTVEVDMPAVTVGRMLRGEFSDLVNAMPKNVKRVGGNNEHHRTA